MIKKYLPYIIIAILSCFILFDFRADRALKQSINDKKETIFFLEKEVKNNLKIISKLKKEYNQIEIPEVDSILIIIDEKDNDFIDSMSIDELKEFLTGHN